MKRTLFIILLLTFKSYSQDITGNWNVVSYEDETMYYNKIKDSIVFKKTIEKDQVERLKQKLELIVFSVKYRFESDGKFTLDFPSIGEVVNGKYKVDERKKVIVMIDEEQKKEDHQYIFRNGILFLRMKMEEGFIKIGLTKVSN